MVLTQSYGDSDSGTNHAVVSDANLAVVSDTATIRTSMHELEPRTCVLSLYFARCIYDLRIASARNYLEGIGFLVLKSYHSMFYGNMTMLGNMMSIDPSEKIIPWNCLLCSQSFT